MKPLVNRVTIIGVGLIGGSLGLAIRRRRLARDVVGVARRPSALRAARRRGAIDWGTPALDRGVRDADLVIIATPPSTIAPLVRRLRPHLSPRAILTDVASTKVCVVRDVERVLARRVAFVGAHPIAGSEARGIAAASARLFDASLCIVTPTAGTDRRAVRLVRRLWVRLGARVVTCTPRTHDRWMASGSHTPHLVAAALLNSMATSGTRRVPRSLLDMTRIAKSDPRLWCDIVLTNAREVAMSLARVERQLRTLRMGLQHRQYAVIMRALARAKRHRDRLT